MEVLKKITGSFNMCEALRRQGIEQKSIFHYYQTEAGKVVPAMLQEPRPENVSAWTVEEVAAGIGPIGRPLPVALMRPNTTDLLGKEVKRETDVPGYWQYFTVSRSRNTANMVDAVISFAIDLLESGAVTPEQFNERILIFHSKK